MSKIGAGSMPTPFMVRTFCQLIPILHTPSSAFVARNLRGKHIFVIQILTIDAHSNVRVLCWFSVRNVPHVPRPYCFRVPYVAGGCASNLRKVIASTCFCAEVFSIMKISGSAEDGWVGLSVSGDHG